MAAAGALFDLSYPPDMEPRMKGLIRLWGVICSMVRVLKIFCRPQLSC